MRLLVSIPLALLGSMLGSTLRGALRVAEQRLDADPSSPPVPLTTTISASPAAAIAGAAVGLVLGARTAFWIGVAFGAAGTERLDARLLGMVGVDLDSLIARATGGAMEAPDEPATTLGQGDAPEGEVPAPDPT